LKWSDVDFDKRQVHINRNFNHGRIFSPKTKSSIRAIDCPPVLMNVLLQWMLRSGGREDDFVFSSDGGKNPLNERTVYNRYYYSFKSNKLPQNTPTRFKAHIRKPSFIARREHQIHTKSVRSCNTNDDSEYIIAFD
jgi:integrase